MSINIDIGTEITESNKKTTYTDYTTAYDCCVTVMQKYKLTYPLDVSALIKKHGIKIVSYSKLFAKYDLDEMI